MKKHTVYKTVQLILLVIVAAVVLLWIFPKADAFHRFANDPDITLLAIAMWAVLVICFVFIYLDFKFFFNYAKEFKELELASKSDPVSGIANRFSCDILVEKYASKPLPDDVGAAVLTLNNIPEINKLYGRNRGNGAIRDFSNILRTSSIDLCFVGRNGGLSFLAIFEHGSEDAIETFVSRVLQRVTSYNRDIENVPIEYSVGSAFSSTDSVNDIGSLISLANSRLHPKDEPFGK